jgi:type II secretory pathway component GspD/PulD (secretin)
MSVLAFGALSLQETRRSSSVRLLDNGQLSVKAENMEVRTLITDLLQAAGEEFSIDPEVLGDIKIEQEGQLDTLLQAITRQVDATYMVQSGNYRVLPRVRCPADNFEPSRITRSYEIETSGDKVLILNVDGMDVRTVLQDLGMASGRQIKVAPNVQGVVTLDVREISLEKTLEHLVRQVDAVAEQRGDSYTVRRK